LQNISILDQHKMHFALRGVNNIILYTAVPVLMCRVGQDRIYIGLAQTVYGISIYRIYAVYDRIYTV